MKFKVGDKVTIKSKTISIVCECSTLEEVLNHCYDLDYRQGYAIIDEIGEDEEISINGWIFCENDLELYEEKTQLSNTPKDLLQPIIVTLANGNRGYVADGNIIVGCQQYDWEEYDNELHHETNEELDIVKIEQYGKTIYKSEAIIDGHILSTDQKVLVRDYTDEEWYDAHLCAYMPSVKNAKFLCFVNGLNREAATSVVNWKYCKLPTGEIVE